MITVDKNRLLRDPLLHFLVLGAVIFLVYFLLNPVQQNNTERRIEINQSDIDRFVQIFQKQWQRKPNKQELEGLVRAHLKEEILYREALALGLEKDDTIVRRRLAQKMEFLITDMTVPAEVDNEKLVAFYEKNSARYARPAKLSFRHVYFDPDRRGGRLPEEAASVLKALRAANDGAAAPEGHGDRFMLPLQYNQKSTDEIARLFGRKFADRLAGLGTGAWHGPVESGYGVHLVYIQRREAATVRPFAEVREEVKNDYLYELQRARNEEVLEKLKSRYEIVIAPVTEQ